MKIVKTKVYQFNELSAEAKEVAIKKNRDINVEGEWWYDPIQEDFKEIARRLGITIENIYFSGFWNQGDGAVFEGSYEYKRGVVKGIKGYAPRDKELLRIARALNSLQSKYDRGLIATLKRTDNRYYYPKTVEVEVYDYNNEESIPKDADALAELFYDLMKWLYRSLQKEYEYCISDEAVAETLRINEYDFTADGKIFVQR